jgi:tetratricopeptide (TPR) repeat protein
MSLLLDALKKAEKAKEEAQRRAERAKAGDALPGHESNITEEPPDRPVRTRDQLPDISETLDIQSEDIAPRGEAAGGRVLELEPAAPPSTPPPQAAERAPTSDAQASQRATARNVFEAKLREPNPRLPFYITLGVLAVFGVGTAGYFWYQLRPPAALVNTDPPRPTGEQPVVAAAPARSATFSQTATAEQTAIPGLPGLPAATTSVPPPRSASLPSVSPPTPKRAEPAARPKVKHRAVRRAQPRQPADTEVLRRESPISTKRPAARIDPHVAAGYAAYQAGDLTAAREAYRRALGDDPLNRDALLGMAAVETREGRYATADALYRRLIEVDPRDAHAQAGLLALRGDQTDPVAAESRVKTLLGEDPGANVLYFTLGNEYARQGRWGEAQQAYFKAYSEDADNPDFAYNLAVSLDHLSKPGLALEYYRRALALAAKRSASFDQSSAQKRVKELGG